MLPAARHQDEKPQDWLSGLSDQNTFTESEEQIGTDQAPSVEDRDVGTSPSPEGETAHGALPDWLGRSESPAGGAETATKRETSGEYESAVDLPEWLAGLDAQNPSVPTVSPHEAPSERLPDWLQDYEGQASPGPMGSSAPEGQEMEAVEATNRPGAPGDAIGLQPDLGVDA